MLIKPISDIHLEFGDFYFPKSEQDKDTTLVLAGDTGIVHKPSQFHDQFLPFIARCSDQFKHVVMILGNHEHYHGSVLTTMDKFWNGFLKFILNGFSHFNIHNVYMLEKSTVVLDDVAFIGATLWTDCDKGSPYAEMLWGNSMSDSKVIRTGPHNLKAYDRPLTAKDTYDDHIKSKEFIWSEVEDNKSYGRKTVVVVHHGVSEQSTHEMYKGSQLNMFFSSEMSEDILDHQPDVIIHGHTHIACEYDIGNTHVVCNPRGYEGYETDPVLRGFDINKIIEV